MIARLPGVGEITQHVRNVLDWLAAENRQMSIRHDGRSYGIRRFALKNPVR
jgi:hypothetical protein